MSLKHLAALACFSTLPAFSQAPASAPAPQPVYTLMPTFDLSSIDAKADPCADFYKFSCGNYAANHPIPADQPSTSGGYSLFNVNTQELSGILNKYEKADAARTPDQQKIGDFYHACMNTDAIEKHGLESVAPLFAEIDAMTIRNLPSVAGKLTRMGVTVFFGYGEQQDFKDASKQIAYIDQGGLGMPEKDYYLRTGEKDEQLRKDYVAHMTKMLTLAGSTPQQALKDANAVMAFETALAKASMGVTERRDPEKVYHLVPISEINKSFPFGLFGQFEDAVHSPRVTEINDTNPAYIPVAVQLIRATDLQTLRAYLRYHLLTQQAHNLPTRFDDENFDFYNRKLNGVEAKRARWKRCSGLVDGSLGEALGKVYVEQYFPAESKRKMLEMVADIEHAMDVDIDQLDWMSAATKVRAKEKLKAVANKIGYPDHWRDYSSVVIKPEDPIGNEIRATQFESDRQLNKIGKPVDHSEWGMTPPTVNAYYDPSMNDINFPAGILQPNFYDPKLDDAVNYGHIGAIIGHELTHGFDDQGKKFDAKGNLSDWWTAEDTKQFEAKTGCEVEEYNKFIAVDDVHVNGKLTLGENTADNGGLLLAYMAFLDRAKKENISLTEKTDGYTAAQRFYIAYGQNWCANNRPEAVRAQVLTDPHSPDFIRVSGPIVNQPAFGAAFACKAGSPMTPAKSCRVW